MAPPLDQTDRLPGALADIDVREIRRVFPRPTLIHIEGETEPPLFLSTLLHGNETTSFAVLQWLQALLADGRPPRSLMIFVGNVRAAEAGVRAMQGEPDFNRIWAPGDTAEHAMAAEILSIARQRGMFASIDIHNNSGRNPVYGCINSLRPQDLHLAAAFAPIGVYYLNPPTTQSIAFSHLGPAITLECGQSGDAAGLAAARSLISHVLGRDGLPATPPPADALQLFETVGRVLVDPDARFTFGPASGGDLVFRDDLESLNFRTVEAGARWAETSRSDMALRVVDEHGSELTGSFFIRENGALRLKQTVVPAMITPDHDIIRRDCLCYLMRPLDWRRA